MFYRGHVYWQQESQTVETPRVDLPHVLAFLSKLLAGAGESRLQVRLALIFK